MNHQDIVMLQKSLEPASTFASADAMLGFVLRVIARLPADEHVGLVKAPASGENVAFHTQSGQWVRVNRVAYPDGTLIKILTDSGPGGANGPTWAQDDTRPDLYVPVPAALPPIPTPVPTPTPTPQPAGESPEYKAIIALGQQVEQLQRVVQALVDKPAGTVIAAPVVFPAYSGRLGMTIRLTPESHT